MQWHSSKGKTKTNNAGAPVILGAAVASPRKENRAKFSWIWNQSSTLEAYHCTRLTEWLDQSVGRFCGVHIGVRLYQLPMDARTAQLKSKPRNAQLKSKSPFLGGGQHQMQPVPSMSGKVNFYGLGARIRNPEERNRQTADCDGDNDSTPYGVHAGRGRQRKRRDGPAAQMPKGEWARRFGP